MTKIKGDIGVIRHTFLEMKVGLASSVAARRFTMSLKDRRDARACVSKRRAQLQLSHQQDMDHTEM